MNTKNDSAAIRTASGALRREVDRLDVKMKEDIGTLKHEIQMELDTRKNEARSQIKQQDIAIEGLLNKAIVSVSDLRTLVEENKWENMRRAVSECIALLSNGHPLTSISQLRLLSSSSLLCSAWSSALGLNLRRLLPLRLLP